jgi:hypothetical protein
MTGRSIDEALGLVVGRFTLTSILFLQGRGDFKFPFTSFAT